MGSLHAKIIYASNDRFKRTPNANGKEAKYQMDAFETYLSELNNATAAMEGKLFSTRDFGWKLGEWSLSECPILLVTGLSGSGKTTLAREIASDHRATLIQLDWYDYYGRYEVDPDDPEYPGWKFLYDAATAAGVTESTHREPVGARYQTFMKFWNLLMDQLYTAGELFVVEGIKIYEFVALDPDKCLWDFFQFPMVVKGTSATRSWWQRSKRDGHVVIGEENAGAFKALRTWFSADKRLQKLVEMLCEHSEPQPVAF